MRKLFFFLLIFCSFGSIAQNYNQIQKITSWHRQQLPAYGDYVEVWGDHLFVGCPYDDKNASGGGVQSGAGAVYVYKRDSLGNWKKHQKIVPTDRDPSDYFGGAISIFNNTLVIGAPGDEHSPSGGQKNSAGSAYVFKKNSSDLWVQVQKINASQRDAGDYFGINLCLFDSLLAVGAHRRSYDSTGNNYLEHSGAVFIFQKDSNGNFVETQVVNDVKRDTSEEFGFYLSLWGNTLAVGAIWDSYDENDTNYLPEDGAVIIYEMQQNGKFQFKQKLVSPNRTINGLFGQDILLRQNTLFIGASRESYDTTGSNYLSKAGSAYVFYKISGVWTFGQHLVNSDRDSIDFFGFSIAAFGNKLAIGSIYKGTDTTGGNFKSGAGAVYYFEKNQFGKYLEKQKLVANDRDVADLFGYNLAMDQHNIFAGSIYEDHDSTGANPIIDAGSAYIFSTCKTAFSSFDTLEICDGDSIFLSGKYRKETGVYVDSFSNKTGCDSNYYHFLFVKTYDPVVVLLMGTLYTDIQGQFYQWVDCDSGNDIPGETGSSFQPTSNGRYAVRVISDSCTFLSDCFDFTTYFIGELTDDEIIQVFPNPSDDGQFNLIIPNRVSGGKLFIHDVTGSIILETSIDGNRMNIQLNDQSPGLYLGTIVSEKNFYQFKLQLR